VHNRTVLVFSPIDARFSAPFNWVTVAEDATFDPQRLALGPPSMASPIQLNSSFWLVPRLGLNFTHSVAVFHLRALDSLVLRLDWSALHANFTHGRVFRFSLWDSMHTRREPLSLPKEFVALASSATTRESLAVRVTALRAANLSVAMEILHAGFFSGTLGLVNSTRSELVAPSRAVLGTRRTFVAIVFTQQLKVVVPRNLLGDMQSLVVVDTASSESGSSPTHPDVAVDIEQEDVTQLPPVAVLPYLPFFSNCRGFDSHAFFFSLFEDHDHCLLFRPEDTTHINEFAFGASAVADTCVHQMNCSYEEQLQRVQVLPRWYESASAGRTLFYLPADAVDFEALSALEPEQLEALFLPQVASEQLVGVSVETDVTARPDAVPRKVTLRVDYHQATPTTKRIVAASLQLSEYDSNLDDTRYELRVEFAPLGFFGMVDRFAFPQALYLVFSIAACGSLVLATVALWTIHRLFTRLRFPPALRLFNYFSQIEPPLLFGYFLAIVPAFALVIFLRQIVDSAFQAYSPAWEASDKEAGPSGQSAQQGEDASTGEEGSRGGRIGTALLVLGVYMLHVSSQLLIPQRRRQREEMSRTKEQDEAREDEIAHHGNAASETGAHGSAPLVAGAGVDSLRARRTRRSSAASMGAGRRGSVDGCGRAAVGSGTAAAAARAFVRSVTRAKEWKRVRYVVVSASLCALLALWTEFTQSTLFRDNLWTMLFTMKLLQWAAERVLRDLLGEALLVIPLSTAMLVVQWYVILAAETFALFMVAWVAIEALLVTERLHLDDALRGLSRLAAWGVKTGRALTLSVGDDMSLDPEGEAGTGQGQASGRTGGLLSPSGDAAASADKSGHALGSDSNTLTPLFKMFSIFSAQSMALLLTPIVIVILTLFDDAARLTSIYGLRRREVVYYLVFYVVVIPTQLLLDVLMLHIQELFNGWRVYDYITYCTYRFKFRSERWQAHNPQMDMGVQPIYRSLDHLSFSSQFYFSCFFHAFAMLVFVLATLIIVVNEFNPLADPITIPVVVIVVAVTWAVGFVCAEAADWAGVWRLNETRLRRADRLADGTLAPRGVPQWSSEYRRTVEGIVEEQFMDAMRLRAAGFRHLFVQRNRPWILEQLRRLLAPTALRRLRPEVRRALLTKVGRLLFRRGDIDVSDSSEEEDPNTGQKPQRRRSSAGTASRKVQLLALVAAQGDSGPVRQMVAMLLRLARFRRMLRGLLEPVFHAATGQSCQVCGAREDLLAVSVQNPGSLMDRYAARHLGHIVQPGHWQLYFRTRVQFVTLCALHRRIHIHDDAPLPIAPPAASMALLLLAVARERLRGLTARSPLSDTNSLSDSPQGADSSDNLPSSQLGDASELAMVPKALVDENGRRTGALGDISGAAETPSSPRHDDAASEAGSMDDLASLFSVDSLAHQPRPPIAIPRLRVDAAVDAVANDMPPRKAPMAGTLPPPPKQPDGAGGLSNGGPRRESIAQASAISSDEEEDADAKQAREHVSMTVAADEQQPLASRHRTLGALAPIVDSKTTAIVRAWLLAARRRLAGRVAR
jgi:hypothetical protein